MAATSGGTPATGARRAQIIDATIETVAELGFARTTFARIADRGGLSSTRLISYHFESKADLMQAVIADVYRSINDSLIERMRAAPATRPIQPPSDRPAQPPPESAGAELSAYIIGVVRYLDGHRTRMRAFQSIVAALHDEAKNPAVVQADPHGAVMSHVQDILRRGQDSGEFRVFDPLVMATMIQRPLEALPLLLESRPELDLDAYAAELVTAVDLATRRPARPARAPR